MKCFYHKNDLDGKCSAAIVRLALTTTAAADDADAKVAKPRERTIDSIGIDYGDAFPWHSIKGGEVVYMVDFSLQPFDEMVRLNEVCDLHWIDHHASAIDAAEQHNFRPHGIRDVADAACVLTWRYMFPYELVPDAVKLLGEYDMWRLDTSTSVLPFQYGVRLYNTTPYNDELWLPLFTDKKLPYTDNANLLSRITAEGQTVLKYVTEYNHNICRSAFETTLCGLRCIALNAPRANSLIFEGAYEPSKHAAMIAFSWSGRGCWTVSLFTDHADVDILSIAKSFGGGGHKGACGFQVQVLPFALKAAKPVTRSVS